MKSQHTAWVVDIAAMASLTTMAVLRLTSPELTVGLILAIVTGRLSPKGPPEGPISGVGTILGALTGAKHV